MRQGMLAASAKASLEVKRTAKSLTPALLSGLATMLVLHCAQAAAAARQSRAAMQAPGTQPAHSTLS